MAHGTRLTVFGQSIIGGKSREGKPRKDFPLLDSLIEASSYAPLPRVFIVCEINSQTIKYNSN